MEENGDMPGVPTFHSFPIQLLDVLEIQKMSWALLGNRMQKEYHQQLSRCCPPHGAESEDLGKRCPILSAEFGIGKTPLLELGQDRIRWGVHASTMGKAQARI